MDAKGFSLVELVVTLAIAATLLTIATLQFSDMSQKSGVEMQMRMILADLMEVRQRALQEKTERAVKFTAGEFATYPGTDTSAAPLVKRQLRYPIALSSGDTALVLQFNTYGIADNASVIAVCVDSAARTSAAVDSLIIRQTKIGIGKRDGGGCAEGSITLK